MKCLDKLIILLVKFFMRVGLIRFIFLILLLLSSNIAALAFEAANPFWFAIKPKLEKYLETAINKDLYQYEIEGPASEMKGFLGNRPDAEIKFEKLNLANPSERKTVVAVAYNSDGSRADSIIINLKAQKFKDILVVKKSMVRGEAFSPNYIYKKKILANPLDERLYYTDSLNQKFAAIDIPAETALKVNMIRHEKLVKTGQQLKVSSGSNNIELSFMCRTASTGDMGDIIPITCPDLPKKNLKAVITSATTGKLN